MTIVNIDSVTAPDAQPTTAPHKVSAQAGKDSLTVAMTISGGADVRALVIRLDAINRIAGGKVLQRHGLVCGDGQRASSNVRSLLRAQPWSPTEVVTDDELATEGDHTLKVWAHDGGAWAGG